ncbi:properdin-like [Mixophyes fleayi]|uniref:properdin-like n=1 Tax=Mixophyes fleayi TaxID=3061075 RepID=UPI003F4D9B5C
MSPLCLLLLVATGAVFTFQVAESDDVLCYAEVNEKNGECEEYLDEGIPELDCCLNIKYGFKRDAHSRCQSCRPAEWTEWGPWSQCSVSCHEGVQERRRICIGQGDCEGDGVEVQSCTLQKCCAENGGWSAWSPWSQCSATCEKGQIERTRECDNPKPSCGGRCTGYSREVRDCYLKQICPSHGSWGNWGPWKECSSDCKTEGSKTLPVQSRQRLCNNPRPSTDPPGLPCEGYVQESRECSDLPFCPVDGGWGAWKRESECTVTCGIGRVREKRSCNNPAPRYKGRDCSGSPTRDTICNTKVPCPIDGQWSEWQAWSPCYLVNGDIIRCQKKVGLQHRKRQCLGTSIDGKWCEGDYRENRKCYDVDRCPLKGTWSEWSEWGLCSSPCGQSERTRFRECLPKYPDYPNVIETTTSVVDVVFSGTPRVRCDAINGQTAKVEEKTACKNLPPCT